MRNKDKKKEYDRKRYENNKELINEKNKEYYEKNKNIIILQQKDYSKKYYQLNKDNIADKHKNWMEENKEKRKEYLKKYREENKEKRKEYLKKYKEEHKEKRNKYVRNRMKNDPTFKFISSVRSLINGSLKRMKYPKNNKTEEILGCTFIEFKLHLESQFEPWMNWENKGNPKDGIYEPNKSWDIDHIIPITVALTEDEIIKLNHYTNLKPMCSFYNRWVKKNNYINPPV